MTEWVLQVLESVVVRTAAFVSAVAALIFFGRRIYKRAAELKHKVDGINGLLARELTDDGNGSLKSAVNQHLELMVAHLADEELHRRHLFVELRKRGIDIEDLPPRERWRWINEGSRRDRRAGDQPGVDRRRVDLPGGDPADE